VELGDDKVGGGDTEGNALAVGLLAHDTVNVDDVATAVDALDTALTALESSAVHDDFISDTDGDRADLLYPVVLV
jgi:hypothetical protein